MVRVAWLFWFSKIIELIDTVSSPPMTFTLMFDNLGIISNRRSSTDFLCAEEERRPDNFPPHLPPLLHALDMVVGSVLRTR